MSNQVRHSHISVQLSQQSRLQQQQMKQNYHRKPIFKRTYHKTNSRISIRDSMIINSHSGDQTTCPQQEQQPKINILKPQRHTEYRSVIHKNQYKNFTIQQSSDQSDKFEYKKPQQPLESSLINYPAIKMTSYSRIFGTGTPKKQIQNKQRNKQRRYFSVQKTSNLKQSIIEDRIQIQNQLLKNQQFLLTQVLISNQRKLRQLQKLQHLQTLNVDYKRKLYDAKLTIQKWTQDLPNNPILKQLLNVLSF